jgi:hypothetical protein
MILGQVEGFSATSSKLLLEFWEFIEIPLCLIIGERKSALVQSSFSLMTLDRPGLIVVLNGFACLHICISLGVAVGINLSKE